MKKLFINLIAMGVITLGYSQEINEEVKELALDEVTVSGLNTTYLHSVNVEEMPPSVDKLEARAARYDVTKSRRFRSSYEAYEVIFTQNNGKIVATYDKDGKILSSFEKFNNIALPPAVRNKIWKDNPGWVIQKDIYMVDYYDDWKVTRTCKIQLVKDGQKKNLKLNLDDIL